jgi:hypothetical protein
MGNKKFNILRDVVAINDETEYQSAIKDTPESILNEYAETLLSDTEGEFIGRVFTIANEETDEITFAFYIVSATFGDLMYRLFEVVQKNLAATYPCTIEFNTINMEYDKKNECPNSDHLRLSIDNFLKFDYTGQVLGYLDRLVKIRNYEQSKSA